MYQDLTQLRKAIKKTLEGDICSAQALDVPADRRRVLDEVMRTLEQEINSDNESAETFDMSDEEIMDLM